MTGPEKRLEDVTTLARNPLLTNLPIRELGTLLDLLEQVSFGPGTVVQRQGEIGEYLYFVLDGTAEPRRGQLALHPLGAGEHFGEIALAGVRRLDLSVEAATELRAARLSRARFQSLATHQPTLALHLLQALLTAFGERLDAMTDSVGRLMRERSLPRSTNVSVRRGDTVTRIATGTSLRALLPSEGTGPAVVAALLDNKPVSLDTSVVADARIEAVTLASPEGREVRRRSAGLLLLEAAARVAPELVVRLGAVVDGGRRVHIEGTFEARDLASRVEREMHELAANDAPFREEVWAVEEARSHFIERGWTDAAALLRTRREATVPLVSCGSVYALGAGPMLPGAAGAEAFRLTPHQDGLLLLDTGDGLPHEDGAVGGEMVSEHARWLAALGITSVGAFNELCISGRVTQLIHASEGFHEKRIGRIADSIATRRDVVRVIAIAGPSSSGKTTFIKRLMVQLEIDGIHPVSLSLDDYYVDRERNVRDARGEYDFEALEALDLPELRQHVARLLAGETVATPRFDFLTGKSVPGGGPELSLPAGHVLLIEGIHALNPALLGASAAARETLFTVFVHPGTSLAFDRLTSIAPADVRLLRRIVRDRRHRGYKAQDNIARWQSVRRGERLHIFPYQTLADAEFDGALAYELSVLKVFAERYLLEVPQADPAFPTALRLRQLLDRFVTIYPDHVPPTSLLREFIGGSGFEY